MENVYPKIEASAPLLENREFGNLKDSRHELREFERSSHDLREFNNILDKEKMKFINEKIQAIQKDLNHYCKLRKRWKKSRTISKIISYVIFISAEVGSGVLIFIPIAGFIVPIIVSGSGLVEMLLSEGVTNFIDKRTKNMDNKIIKCRSILDKLFLFLEEAKMDRVIDSTELAIFNKIINEYYSGKEEDVKTDNNKEELKQNLVEIEDFKKKLKDQINHLSNKK